MDETEREERERKSICQWMIMSSLFRGITSLTMYGGVKHEYGWKERDMDGHDILSVLDNATHE